MTVSLLTFCSRILGFVREMVAAQLFGASTATDAFYAVFRLPNVLRQVFAEGAFTLALVPLLHSARSTGGPEAEAALAGRVLALLLMLLVPLTLLGLLLAPWLVHTLLPGLVAAEGSLAVQMVYWTLPYVLIVALVGWSAAWLHAHDHFAVPAITPLLLSLCLIVLPLGYASNLPQPVLALAIAVLLGGVLQLLWQGVAVMRLKTRPWLRLDWRHPALRQLAAVLLPALLAASTLQIILLIDTLFASRLSGGSVTWLYLAERIVQFPQGVLGTALSVVLVQRLAQAANAGEPEHYRQLLDRALRLAILLGMLTAVVAWCCAEHISWTLYGYGQFSALDVQMTARAVASMAWGLPAVLLVRALSAATLATARLRLLCSASALAILTDLLGNLLLPHWPSATGIGHVAIAAISAVAVWVYAGALLFGLMRQAAWRLTAASARFVLRVLLASVVLWLSLLGLLSTSWFELGPLGPGSRVLLLTTLLATAVLVYFSTAWIVGLRYRQLR